LGDDDKRMSGLIAIERLHSSKESAARQFRNLQSCARSGGTVIR
jgi:hypothetical protein